MKRELMAFMITALVSAVMSLSSVDYSYSASVKREPQIDTINQIETEKDESTEFESMEDILQTEAVEESDMIGLETEEPETEASEAEPLEDKSEESQMPESMEEMVKELVEPETEIVESIPDTVELQTTTPPNDSSGNTGTENSNSTTSEPERKSIPSQTESTASIGSNRIDVAKSTVKSYVTEIQTLGYSNDLENAAILRAQGQGQNGMDVLTQYGGDGWELNTWAEVRGATYFLSDTDEAIVAAADAVCSSLAAGTIGSSTYKEYGVGIHVTGEAGMYTLQIVVLLTN